MDFNPNMLQTLLTYDLGAEPANMPLDDMSVDQVRRLMLHRSLLKKWIPDDQKGLDEIAVAKFLHCNDMCAKGFSVSTDATLKAIQLRAKSLIETALHSQTEAWMINNPSCFPVLTLAKCLDKGMVGPGSSRGVGYTSFYRKMFAADLTMTDLSLYRIYRDGIKNSTWNDAESVRQNMYGSYIVKGSNLSTVPKSSETNRTICTEPSLNMYFQRGAGNLIEEALLNHFNISFKTRNFDGVAYDQPAINRRMAQEGSMSGLYATIDLSSASDTISTDLVRFLLPEHAFSVLDLLRSKSTTYKGVDHELYLFSSMGNGFTFPLQTLIFSALVKATYYELGIHPQQGVRSRNYSVFGDDIICLKQAYDIVTLVLESCGFTVNKDKSFNSGPFRESCGHDYFKGHNVRGVYLKGVKNHADLYSAFNRLLRWSCYSGVVCTYALSYIKGLVDFRPIPLHEDDAVGIKLPYDQLSSRKLDPNTGSVCYRPLIPVIRRVKLKEGDPDFNPFGALSASIGGYVRNGKYDERTKNPNLTYKVAKRMTPCWDHVTDAGLTSRDFSFIWSHL